MNLAAEIAAPDSDMGPAFIDADRMPDLVESMAWSSKNLILADAKGAEKLKGRKKKDGETLGLWTVKSSVE